MLSTFGFSAVPASLIAKGVAGLSTLKYSATSTMFSFESSTLKGAGMGPYVLSSKRKAYSDLERASLVSAVAMLQAQLTTVSNTVYHHHDPDHDEDPSHDHSDDMDGDHEDEDDHDHDHDEDGDHDHEGEDDHDHDHDEDGDGDADGVHDHGDDFDHSNYVTQTELTK
jgi:hypothetical protein